MIKKKLQCLISLIVPGGFVAQRFEIQSPLIEPNLRRNLGKWST